MKLTGNVWKFGDHIDTDLIIPARFLNVSDEEELAKNCFVDLRPDFAEGAKAGGIIVAGENFGCGSSREHAPIAIKAAGIQCVIAQSFARIFYRNAFNIGLPILEAPEAADLLTEGDAISVDLDTGEIKERKNGRSIRAMPLPPFMQQIIECGGLVPYIKKNAVETK